MKYEIFTTGHQTNSNTQSINHSINRINYFFRFESTTRIFINITFFLNLHRRVGVGWCLRDYENKMIFSFDSSMHVTNYPFEMTLSTFLIKWKLLSGHILGKQVYIPIETVTPISDQCTVPMNMFGCGDGVWAGWRILFAKFANFV